MSTLVTSLREAAEVLEEMAVGAVNLASQRSTESPYAGTTPEQQQSLVQQMQERKSYIYDAGQNVQIAEVMHRLADRADKAANTKPVEIDRGEILASAVSDAAAEYSERLARIEGFVSGFRNVPDAVKWFEHVGQPILNMARGKTQ